MFFVNEGYPTVQMVAGLQILSSGITGQVSYSKGQINIYLVFDFGKRKSEEVEQTTNSMGVTMQMYSTLWNWIKVRWPACRKS